MCLLCIGSFIVRSRARLLQTEFSVLEGEDLPEMCLEIRSERERIAPTTVSGGSSYGSQCMLELITMIHSLHV